MLARPVGISLMLRVVKEMFKNKQDVEHFFSDKIFFALQVKYGSLKES